MPITENCSKQMVVQLVSEVMQMCPEVDQAQLQMKLAGIISLYDVRPSQLQGMHQDIQDKVKQFLSAKKLEGLSPLTLDDYKSELKIFGRNVSKPVEQISTGDIRSYLAEFPKLKTSSISKKLSVLKSFFGWLTAEEIIERDPTRKIKPPKKEQRLPKALTIEELEMLRESCNTYRERALLEVLYATAGRLSEIQGMNKEDINYQSMSALVIGKGNKQREVFFSFKAIYHLKKYLMTRLDDEPALFITERKPYRRLSSRSIQREIKKIAKRSGIKKNVHPHTLRHTFATLTLNNGADISSVQAILGHENPATTQIYAQVSAERKRDQYKRYLVQ